MTKASKRKARQVKARQKVARKKNRVSPQVEEMAKFAAGVSDEGWTHILTSNQRKLYRVRAMLALAAFKE